MTTPAQTTAQWRDSMSQAVASRPGLGLFALVDMALDRRATALLRADTLPSECLFGYALDLPMAEKTPRLVQLPQSGHSPFADWLLDTAAVSPLASVLATDFDLTAMTEHLRACIDVELEGLDSMFLAVWDPAILGTLVGQADDPTLHVPGPVLSAAQRSLLLGPVAHWWYCDRDGGLHDVAQVADGAFAPDSTSDAVMVERIVLDAEQTDALVEASVPDHLLAHIRENQPELLERLPTADRYRFVRQQLARARAHGLVGTGDLVNYVCVALAFGARFDEVGAMAGLLARVRAGSMRFDEALKAADEAELEAAAEPPVLL